MIITNSDTGGAKMASLGQNISELRKKHGLSQAQLADKLGIGTSTLGMYETNKREPSYQTLLAIADFFNKSIDELLGRDEAKSKDVPLNYGDLGLPYKGAISEDLNDTFRLLAKQYAEKHNLPKRDA
ncbi:transcriptional regulator, xre family [Lactobacillus hamsteri DSM 5661 = JCM 6256]|uniref:Transcriptional regulator, xre family n=2 Tax=Lactobacillus hamsteri TaxID=96565 RepID=A0A0R1Y8U0_9LACO|nr:transcriptional regulator, xre family [Lactobacillus hamsteri DSM 5661 = JCM 6256]